MKIKNFFLLLTVVSLLSTMMVFANPTVLKSVDLFTLGITKDDYKLNSYLDGKSLIFTNDSFGGWSYSVRI